MVNDMDILTKNFIVVFKTPMEQLGFICANNCFYRQVNDVLQTLTLSRMFNFGYELKFNILPLCIPISKALPSGIMGPIESFEDGQVRYFYRNYTKETPPEIIQKNMERGMELVFQDIVPIFLRGVDAKSAYCEMVLAEEKRFGRATLHEPLFKWLALMGGNYDRAVVHQAAIIASNLGMPLIQESEILDPQMLEKLLRIEAGDEPYLKEQKMDLAHIAQHNYSYFDKIIEENTKKTLTFLKKVNKNPCKYGSFRY